VKIVVPTDRGVLELNWMWLPTWIGMNNHIKMELEGLLSKELVGLPVTEETLDRGSELVIKYLEAKYAHLKGLREFFDGLKFIEM
jgi:hypothetical protein